MSLVATSRCSYHRQGTEYRNAFILIQEEESTPIFAAKGYFESLELSGAATSKQQAAAADNTATSKHAAAADSKATPKQAAAADSKTISSIADEELEVWRRSRKVYLKNGILGDRKLRGDTLLQQRVRSHRTYSCQKVRKYLRHIL